MTMPSPIEVEAHEFSQSVADLKGLSQDNIMNDYDNRQLIGRGQRLPYVNDHDKRASENKADRRLQVHAETERCTTPARRPSRKNIWKTIPRISVENAFKETTLIKSDLAYEQLHLRQCLGFAACRGSSPLVPYNNSQRNESTGRHANGLGCS
jgi:hypothetical protein